MCAKIGDVRMRARTCGRESQLTYTTYAAHTHYRFEFDLRILNKIYSAVFGQRIGRDRTYALSRSVLFVFSQSRNCVGINRGLIVRRRL